MFKSVQIIEDSETRMVVKAKIKNRKWAKDQYIMADLQTLKEVLLRDSNIDVSSLRCSKQQVLCNYTEPPLLEADFVFQKPLPKSPPKPMQKRSLTKTAETDIIQVESKSGVTPAPTARKRRSRASTKKQQENKLLGTKNLE